MWGGGGGVWIFSGTAHIFHNLTIIFPVGKMGLTGLLIAQNGPVSPVVASLCMEEFEESVISNSSVPQKIWKRYVDDSFCIIGKDDVSAFHGTLNSIDTNISFATETQCNGKISFLDTQVSRRNVVIAVDVYRKPAHTDSYLDFNSHHDNQHKASSA